MPILKNYNVAFFRKLNSHSAYVLGFLCADGSIVITKRATHFISFHSADHDLIQMIRSCFGSNHTVASRVSKTGVVYRLQIGSYAWFQDLSRLGVHPQKTKRMRIPHVPRQYMPDFIRGYFDGDGNVWTGYIHRDRATPSRTLQVAFTSCSHEFLSDILTYLRSQGVQGGSLYRSKKKAFSRLLFSVKDALIIHRIMYNGGHKLFLGRKKRVFDQFVDNCGGSSTG